jgi:F420-0:gamma-glutamyl ligase-like protein
MLGIAIFVSTIYFFIEKQFNFGIAALIVAVIYSKYITGYYCLGLECLLDSESDCDSFSDSGGGGD